MLPRRSRFSRRTAGDVTDEQVVAANVAVIFIVMALDADICDGVHFRTSTEVGAAMGRKIGQLAAAKFFGARP